MPDVLIVAAGELGHPMVLFILMKANDCLFQVALCDASTKSDSTQQQLQIVQGWFRTCTML
jgi:hypothetical protein